MKAVPAVAAAALAVVAAGSPGHVQTGLAKSIIGTLPYGQPVGVFCYMRADSVTGWGGTTDEWDRQGSESTGDGFMGRVSDAWATLPPSHSQPVEPSGQAQGDAPPSGP
ncbi:MAG TPA: hypothetical protein VGZ32_21600 [Actinocrinis sp.]|nr:hypothetical protein [Actinocrinis sp.]